VCTGGGDPDFGYNTEINWLTTAGKVTVKGGHTCAFAGSSVTISATA
jgi:hypothetical protein